MIVRRSQKEVVTSQEAIDKELLKQFKPFDKMSENQLILVSQKVHLTGYKKGRTVLELGSSDNHDYFLVRGEVELVAADGRARLVASGTEGALTAIAHLQPRQYQVKTKKDSVFLVIAQDIVNHLVKEAPMTQHSSDLDDDLSAGKADPYSVLMSFYSDLKSNNFTLPSLPDVAYRIRKVAENERATAEDIAKVINTDPAMTVKLLKACNSPLYRGFSEATSCRDAVVRLGITTTQQLVSVFSMRELFRSSREELKKAMAELWNHSRQVASIAYILAEMTPGLDKDTALLAGLIHDVGAIAVITYAEQVPELYADTKALQKAVDELRAEVGVTMLKHWGFADELLSVVEHAENWYRDSGKDHADYVDLIVVSQLHALIGQASMMDLPSFNEVPAFRKLAAGGLTPEKSFKVMVEARHKFDELQEILGPEISL